MKITWVFHPWLVRFHLWGQYLMVMTTLEATSECKSEGNKQLQYQIQVCLYVLLWVTAWLLTGCCLHYLHRIATLRLPTAVFLLLSHPNLTFSPPSTLLPVMIIPISIEVYANPGSAIVLRCTAATSCFTWLRLSWETSGSLYLPFTFLCYVTSKAALLPPAALRRSLLRDVLLMSLFVLHCSFSWRNEGVRVIPP